MAKKSMAIGITIGVLVIIAAAVVLFSGALHGSNAASSDAASASSQQSSAAGQASVRQPSQQPSQQPTQQPTQQAPAQSSQQKIKFADTQYYNYAYDISDNSTSSREKAALSGFDVQKTQNADGTLSITLKALEPQYQDQSYTLKAGQTLYFIEGAFGDDSANREYSLGDDMAVAVDSEGYVIQN